MPRRRGSQPTNRHLGRRSKPTAEERSRIAVTTTIYHPPENPPSRNYGAPWRRVLQISATVANTQQQPIAAQPFFNDRFNTTGFSVVYLHRVAVWSSANGVNNIYASLSTEDGKGVVGLSYKDSPSQSDRRAVVGFRVPNYLSPYGKSSFMLIVGGDTTYIVEIDATFA